MYELIELTDSELDAVAGGNPFSINISAALHNHCPLSSSYLK